MPPNRPRKPFRPKPRPATAKISPLRENPKPFAANTTDWSGVAEWYDTLVGDDGSEFHRHVVLPGVWRLLGGSAGQTTLDVACGQGVLCRFLHERGVRAVGVDAAADLIARARHRGPDEIAYHVGDVREPSALPAGPFDAATCVLALQNVHPIRPVIANVASRLKPGGRFIVVIMHPCFRGPKGTSWGWDSAGDGGAGDGGAGEGGAGDKKPGVQYRRVDRYLLPRKVPIVTHPGRDPNTYTWSFHRPLGDYVNVSRSAGLLVDAMEEWPSHKTSDSGPRAAAENRARAEIPMFLAIRYVNAADLGTSDNGSDGS